MTTPSGVKVEVKSAGYIQSWFQKDYSSISFVVKARRGWDALTNVQAQIASRKADVYVFALLAHKDQDTVDPLDLSQWRFYVVLTRTLDERKRSQHSIALRSLEQLSGGALRYDELAASVDAAAGRGGPSREAPSP